MSAAGISMQNTAIGCPYPQNDVGAGLKQLPYSVPDRPDNTIHGFPAEETAMPWKMPVIFGSRFISGPGQQLPTEIVCLLRLKVRTLRSISFSSSSIRLACPAASFPASFRTMRFLCRSVYAKHFYHMGAPFSSSAGASPAESPPSNVGMPSASIASKPCLHGAPVCDAAICSHAYVCGRVILTGRLRA